MELISTPKTFMKLPLHLVFLGSTLDRGAKADPVFDIELLLNRFVVCITVVQSTAVSEERQTLTQP